MEEHASDQRRDDLDGSPRDDSCQTAWSTQHCHHHHHVALAARASTDVPYYDSSLSSRRLDLSSRQELVMVAVVAVA